MHTQAQGSDPRGWHPGSISFPLYFLGQFQPWGHLARAVPGPGASVPVGLTPLASEASSGAPNALWVVPVRWTMLGWLPLCDRA